MKRLIVIFYSLSILIQSSVYGGERPNVVFLFSDDQRADAVGALGNPDIRTPSMDRLIEGGTYFSQAYVQGTMTPATCLPCRAMLMSGKPLFRAPLQLDSGTLMPEVFRRAGYRTFATGKWHNGQNSFLKCFNEAEAVFFGGAARDHYQVPLHYREGDRMVPYEVPGVFSTVLFADAAVSFLKKQQGSDQPFFCYVPFTSPHAPFVPPGEYATMYDPEEITLPPNFQKGARIGGGVGRGGFGRGGVSGRGRAQNYASYYGMITHLDHHIGRILEAIRQYGHSDDTLIVFASDHGLSMGSHGLNGKHNAYEHSSRSIITLSGPGIPKKKSSALVYLYDLYPTLCELAGLKVPEEVEGLSLVDCIHGRKDSPRDYLFTAYMQNERAIRDQQYKLFARLDDGSHQLFDLRNDPHELNDLSQKASSRDIVKRLQSELVKAREAYGDTPEAVQRGDGFRRRRF
jgi:arylsulfatase A-like enzyme